MATTPASERVQCVRCDRFSPASELDADGICDDCVSRLTELERVPPSVGNVIVGAVRLVPKIGLPALLVVTGIAVAMYFVDHEYVGIPFVGWALDVAAQAVLLSLAHRAIHGRRIDLRATALATTDHLLRLFLVAFIAHLQVLLLYAAPSILFGMAATQIDPESFLTVMVPGLILAQVVGLALALWRASSLAVALPVALHEGHSGLSALGVSTRRMKGHRLPAFVFAVGGFVWLVIPIAHAILMFFAMGLGVVGELLAPERTAVWTEQLAAITPALEIGQAALTAIALLFTTFVSAVLYAKTVGYRVY